MLKLEIFCIAAGVIVGFLGGLYYASHTDDDDQDSKHY